MHPVTTEGKLLQQISGQLDELLNLLREQNPTPADTSSGRVEVRGSDTAPRTKSAPRKKK